MIEIRENISDNRLNEDSRELLFDALDRMNDVLVKKNRSYHRKVVLENIVGDIPEEDLIEEDKDSAFDKISDKIIKIQAKLDMRSSKIEKKACQIALEKALNVKLSSDVQKQYKMKQFYETLKEIEMAISTDYLDEVILKSLYKKLEKNYEIIIPTLNKEKYEVYDAYMKRIKNNLIQKLFDLKLNQAREYQKQKQKAR